MSVTWTLFKSRGLLDEFDLHCIYIYFFSMWVFIHEHSQTTGLQGEEEGISLTPHCHFHPLHRYLDISRVIIAESSPLHIANSLTRTGNLSERKSLTTKLRALNCILGKGNHFFKFVGKFRYLGMKDLSKEFLKDNSSITVKFREYKTGQITAGVYLLFIVEIVIDVQQIRTGALLFANIYNLSQIWRNNSKCLFDSHSKDENVDLSSSATAVV